MVRLKAVNLRCEYLENPIGVDIYTPCLSWQLSSEEQTVSQSAYRILVAESLENLSSEENLIWDSGRVASANSLHIPFAGKALKAEKRYYWTVQVWDREGHLGETPQTAYWQMGLGNRERWQAKWIGFKTNVDEAVRPPGQAGNDSQFFGEGDAMLNMRPPAYFRRAFELQERVSSAVLYITARGIYDVSINAQAITENRLTPGWTDYHKSIEYQTYDVTPFISKGENVIGVILADGWYAGYLGPGGNRGIYGDTGSFLAQLKLSFADGSEILIVSDESWKANEGALRYAEIYHGEYYDARREEIGWNKPQFNDRYWQAVTLFDMPDVKLDAQLLQPIRVTETLSPIAIDELESGVYLVDMGQNMAGWVRLKAKGAAGTKIQLRFAEALLPDGRIDTLNLNSARASDTWILRGEGREIFEPRFTYHGFRYVEVSGYPDVLTADDISACVLHVDLPLTGAIESSSPMVNKIVENTLWSQRSNFYSVPTDCPQRAERLGWTGDVFGFSQTAAYNMDCGAYYRRWMNMLIEAQSDEGAFPNVVPRVAVLADGAPAWGDVGIYLPWLMYQVYGDKRIIERHYRAMTRWMEYILEANLNFLWQKRRNPDFGDWLAYNDYSPNEVVATAIWAMDALWMADMADILGLSQNAMHYRKIHQNIADAFAEAYISNKRIEGDTQAVYVLSLAAEILSDEMKQAAIERLVQLIQDRDWHLSTGFVATPLLMTVLSENERSDVAYRLLLQDSLPSWGYMVKQGATTQWERWDGDIEMRRLHGLDDSPRSFAHPVIGELAGMNSYNHFALGSVTGWIYQYILGIQSLAGGFQKLLIKPHIDVGLDYARGHYDSIRGRIAVSWEKSQGKLDFEISIPANVTAQVILPSDNPAHDAQAIAKASSAEQAIELELGSGTYHIQTSWRK